MADQEKNGNEINQYWEKMGILTGSLQDVYELAKMSFASKHVLCLIGEAGIGKTAIFSQLGKDLKYNVMYYYLAHLEREDIGGIPMPSDDKSSYRFLCEESIQEVINTTTPTIMVLDEWNRGEKPVMNAAFTLMEQRRFGSYTMPDHVYIAAAMNPSEGSYLVNEAEKDPAFRRRLCFVGVRADPAVWMKYATGRGKFHPLVTDYIAKQPHHLLDVESREAGKVYANPASWEKVSDTHKALDAAGTDMRTVMHLLRLKFAGHIGSGITESYLSYLQENSTAVNPEEILLRYKGKVRSDIKKLVSGNQLGAINEISEGVAMTLASKELAVEDCVENIGTYAADLPADASIAFFIKITGRLADLSKVEYKTALLRALSKNPAFHQAYAKIQEAQERVTEDMEN